MRTRISLFLLIATALSAADQREEFEMRVRPLLAAECWTCHRQTALGGLRLDSREAILKGGKSGPAVTPGNPAGSLLLQAVNHTHARLKMPPSGKLPDEKIQTLARWIESGAFWPDDDKAAAPEKAGKYTITPEQRSFWAFQPVRRVPPPEVKNAAGVHNDIDRFILARLEREGLQTAPAADRRTLIRRATVDLTGLPPAKAEVDAFLADKSPDAFTKVVDRLLASPRYGERWGRYWLDVARYADDRFNSTTDDPYPNSWRYRNWVIDAFNRDMPWDRFVRAQIAGDKTGEPAALGFYALSPEMQDDRVDATTRGFLGLTVACATCHDHKFDPIPTQDFYSLQGIFSNTKLSEHPLVPKETSEAWDKQKKALEEQENVVSRFLTKQREMVAEMLASRTAAYVLAAKGEGYADGLDCETVERWRKYLAKERHDHPFLKDVLAATPEKLREAAAAFERLVVEVNEQKKAIDDRNRITLGVDPDRNRVANATLESLERSRYILWRDLFERSTKDSAGFFRTDEGVYYQSDKELERFLSGPYLAYLKQQREAVEAGKKALPERYPFLQVISDKEKLEESHVFIRGDRNNKGEAAPPRFLAILTDGERKPFTRGAGREDLADAIADPANPLTARVIVNRVWHHHFGRGIVATPSNFGQLGERPTHPELLDHLAAWFVDNGWSLKKLHRYMLLSAAGQRSADAVEANLTKDPDNKLLWRANRERLDAEALRDSMLAVAGSLDLSPGEKADKLDEKNRKRTVYGFVGRRRLDPYLALFDFPSPVTTSESRLTTNVPLQRLFFMNSEFVEAQAKALTARFGGSPAERIRGMYGAVFARDPQPDELAAGEKYIGGGGEWFSYARALLSSNEFLFRD